MEESLLASVTHLDGLGDSARPAEVRMVFSPKVVSHSTSWSGFAIV